MNCGMNKVRLVEREDSLEFYGHEAKGAKAVSGIVTGKPLRRGLARDREG